MVDAYGSSRRINQGGYVNVPETPACHYQTVGQRELVSKVEKSDPLNPSGDSTLS